MESKGELHAATHGPAADTSDGADGVLVASCATVWRRHLLSSELLSWTCIAPAVTHLYYSRWWWEAAQRPELLESGPGSERAHPAALSADR